jgi:hypothetical protein
MADEFEPGALLGRTFPLPRGPRVRLRLARVSDLPAIEALLERKGIAADELTLARLVRVDPRKRLVICASALTGFGEELVGIGAIDVDLEPRVEPAAVVVDERLTDGLDALLASALLGRARTLALARARAS